MAAKALLFLLSSLLLLTIEVKGLGYKEAPAMAPHYEALPPSSPSSVIPRNCARMCIAYCDLQSPGTKRTCQRICSACCAKCNCVPLPGGKVCGKWDKILYHGAMVTCP